MTAQTGRALACDRSTPVALLLDGRQRRRAVLERRARSGARVAVILAASLCLLGGCARREPLKIGVLAGLSGPAADLGNGVYNGIRLSVEEANSQGGVMGREVTLIVEDDRNDPATARAKFDQLVQAGAELVLGPTTSTMAIEVAPLAGERKVVLFSPSATTTELSGRDDHFLRLVPPLTALAQLQARHLYKVGARRLALATGAGNPSYVSNYAREVTAAFTAAGGTVLPAVALQPDGAQAPGFEAAARTLRAAGPDAVLVIAAGGDVALLALQLRRQGAPVHLASAHWADTPRLLRDGGADIEGLIVTQYFDPDSAEPGFRQFSAHYRDRFGSAPGFAGIYGYETARYALTALARRQPDQTVKQALLALPAQPGLQGPVHMDARGDGLSAAQLGQVRQGRIVALRD
jgi:branched-chain amino acid transport system substrate-binding protein